MVILVCVCVLMYLSILLKNNGFFFQKIEWAIISHPWLWTSNLWFILPVFIQLSSIQFSCSVVSDYLWPHELQHARPPCPSPSPGVHSNSCPSSWWCHLAISSSVVPFSSWPQSLPVSGSFPMCQLFAWGGQSIGVSASASVLPVNSQDWSPLVWTCWQSNISAF